MKIRRMQVALYFAIGLLATLGGRASAQVVYNQPPTFPNSLDAGTSTYDPTTYGSIYNVYDDFTLTLKATVTSLTWQGLSFNNVTQGATTTPVQSFNVSFYANASGLPGAMLLSQTIGFTQSATGTVSVYNNGQSETLYNYSGNLSTGFAAAAGTTYWVSIQGVTNYPAQWSWTSGSGGNGSSYQMENPAYGTNTGTRNLDRDFSLSVPEPSTFVILGFGALMLFSRRWLPSKA